MAMLVNKMPVNLILVVVFAILAIVLCIFAGQLSTTTKEEQLLPDDHPFQRIIDMCGHPQIYDDADFADCSASC